MPRERLVSIKQSDKTKQNKAKQQSGREVSLERPGGLTCGCNGWLLSRDPSGGATK